MKMEAGRTIRSLTFATVLVLVQLSALITLPEVSSALTPHPPIIIDGNADFIPANGVTGGNGTPSNPYLIEGWDIDVVGTGIDIDNTSAHFIIRDVFIHSGAGDMYGIVLNDVANAKVENASIVISQGIIFDGLSNASFMNSSIQAWQGCVQVEMSEWIALEGNQMSTFNGDCVRVSSSNNVTISSNNITNFGALGFEKGIYLDFCHECTIADNYIILLDWGTAIWLGNELILDPSDHINVTGNNITGNARMGTGIWIWRIINQNLKIEGNTINNTAVGFVCQVGCPGILIYHNNFVGNFQHASGSGANNFDDGYPSGGNYWDNYTGIDNCSGPNQDVCPDPDGIGDTPFIIDANSRDGYPLINPFALPPPTPPTPPRSVQASDGGCGDISLSWNAPASDGGATITNFRIYRGNTSGGEVFLVEVGGLLTFDDSGLTGGQTYFYQVSAVNKAGEGNKSNEANATAKLCQVPSKPQNLGATHGSDFVTLTWNAPLSDGNSSITNYRIYRGISPGGEAFHVEIGNVTSYNDTGLTGGQTYYYQVTAVNGIGEGPLSNEVGATPRTAPGPPTDFNAELGGIGFEDVVLTWTLSNDDGAGQNSIVSYEVLASMTFDPAGVVGYGHMAFVPNGTATFVHPLAGEGDMFDYFYRICALDKFGNSTCSQTQAGKFRHFLTKGINLVSVPLITSDGSIQTVLQTLAYDNVWAFDSTNQAWETLDLSKPYSGSLGIANHTVGVLANVTRDSNLTVAGIVPPVTSIHLEAGWNFVGFPSFNSTYTVADLKAATGAIRVEGFDPTSPPYFLKVLLDGEVLQAGMGYWIYVGNQIIWTVDNS